MPDIDAPLPHYNSKIPAFLVTFFNAAGARHKREETISLPDLAELISSQQAEAKDLLPWLKLARFGAVTTAHGSLRHDANVLAITGIEADYDGEQISVDQAIELLQKAGIEALIYTSPSHEPDRPRWRVLAPLAEAASPAERRRLLARLNGALGGVIDDASFTLSQSYYYGHLYECAEFRVELTEGEPLDRCDHLDLTAIGKSATRPGNGPDPGFFERADLDELDRRIVSGESLHPSIIRIVGKLAADGATKDMARSYIGALVSASSRAAEARSRWNEFEREIDYVYAKEARKDAPTDVEPDITDPTGWDGLPIPEQDWVVRDLIPAQQVCLFSGPGAAGKSTIGLHQCAAFGLGRMWLNFDCGLGATKALFIDAEDDLTVIHRRLAAVITHYNCSFADLNGNLHILSLAGRNALLATAEKNGVVTATELFKAVAELAKKHQYRVIVIASVANVFAGNENDRSQVTQFIHLLKGLAITSNGSVILISHPSLTAITDKRGSSGSTAWLNAVRAQMHLDKAAENGAADVGLRKLEFKKNQYGAPAAALTLTWHNGMFLPEAALSDYEKAARAAKADALFLKLLHADLNRGNQWCQIEASPYYAPRKLAAAEEAKGFQISELKAAMNRCLDNGTLVPKMTEGPPSKRRPYIGFP
jgi:RecA-family ATPase